MTIPLPDMAFYRSSPGHGQGVYPLTFDEVFSTADKCTLVVVDAVHEHEWFGWQLIQGKELNFYVIRDGRMVRFKESSLGHKYDIFIYPYNPVEHRVEYTPDAASVA